MPLRDAVGLAVAAGVGVVGALGAALWRRYRRCRREADELRREREVMMGFVHDVAEVFSETDEEGTDALLERVLFYALRTSGALSGAIYLMEPDGGTLRVRAVSGLFAPLGRAWTEPLGDTGQGPSAALEAAVRAELVRTGEGIVGDVAWRGAARLIHDAEREPSVPRHGPPALRVRTLAAVPMRFRNRVMGVLVAVNRADRRPFTPSDVNLLQALADQASVSVHYARLRDELDEKRRLDHDLALARQIQAALLPRCLPTPPGAEFAAVNVPARQVGGDYYDAIQVDDRRIGLMVADVSGKGVAGALWMSVCRSVTRATAPGCPSPAAVLRALNRVMSPDLGGDMFVTALYMVLDPPARRVTVARAGHEAPVLYRPLSRGLTRIDSPGVGIGIGDPAMFDELIEDVCVPLECGDVLVAFTDGLSEARNDQGEEFGADRIMETVVRTDPPSATAVVEALQDRVRRFSGGRPFEDDLTILVARLTA
ncbi:MAG: SpoIIE family protein phosphatase [Kiritimatiellae bacterium]|nr:SpoIIE family protein phosphatase [Kiritimatiellia bacterium]